MPSKKSSRVPRNPKPAAGNRLTASKTDLLFQFKITLLKIEPPIWRRIQVPDCTLADLHELIQAAMGWENYHLHQFFIGGVRYGIADFELGVQKETKCGLASLFRRPARHFVSVTNMILAIAGCTIFFSKIVRQMTWGRSILCASKDQELVHRKTWVGCGAMPNS